MNIAQQYNYQFVVYTVNGRKIPSIETGRDSNGSNMHTEMASFIRGCGAQLSQSIIDEINDLNLATVSPPIVNFFIGGSYEDFVEVSSPGTASFPNTNGGTYDYPIEDLIGLFQEWIDFLNSLPFKHRLSNS